MICHPHGWSVENYQNPGYLGIYLKYLSILPDWVLFLKRHQQPLGELFPVK
jgi:hypothetical protein